MPRIETKTNFFIFRHDEKTPVARLRTGDKNEMVGKQYGLRAGAAVYQIDKDFLTEKKIKSAEEGEPFTVTDVLVVDSQYMHPSTWSQNENIFLVSGNTYVHFGSAQNILDAPAIIKQRVKAGAEKVKKETAKQAKAFGGEIFKGLILALIIWLIIENIFKKI